MIIIQRCYNYNIKIQVLQKCFSQKYIQESFVCSGGVEVLLLNKDMLHTLFNQLWRGVAGPALLICIPLFLTPVEQGYWDTGIPLQVLLRWQFLQTWAFPLSFYNLQLMNLHICPLRKMVRFVVMLRLCGGWLHFFIFA